MLLLTEILFWACLLAILHSYVFYPLLLAGLSRGKQQVPLPFLADSAAPQVSVLMAVYNEEKVIAEKLDSLLALDYPAGKLHIFIGSDCSADRTNEILAAQAGHMPQVHLFLNRHRQGKPGVINQLAAEATARSHPGSGHVFIITDANVLPNPLLLRQLTRHFQDPRIAIVDAHLVHTGIQAEGISAPENTYINREVMLKHREGLAWGLMMGPFGGCYAIRAACYREVPSNFLVDDFYIAMRSFEQGGLAISDLDAHCYEAVSHEIQEEYRRKARISTGNFQNLHTFAHLWWPPLGALRFAFFSHKVLRWLGPLWIIGLLLCATVLQKKGYPLYQLAQVLLLTVFAAMPLADALLNRLGVHLQPLRAARYFVMMNIALLEGFFKFLKGVKNNVWEPPKRN